MQVLLPKPLNSVQSVLHPQYPRFQQEELSWLSKGCSTCHSIHPHPKEQGPDSEGLVIQMRSFS